MQTIENYRENIFKEGIKRMLFYADSLRVFYDEVSNYLYHRQFEKCSKEVKKMHNKHKGDRCFIVATGPSLNSTDLNLIRSEIVFGVNTAFQTLNKYHISSDYYVVSDRIMWDVYNRVLMLLDTRLFLGYVASRHYFRDGWNGFKKKGKEPLIMKGKGGLGFSKDIAQYIDIDIHTVVYLALQIAYYLGFKEVYLLGCDCDYSGGHAGGLGFVDSSKIQIGNTEKEFWGKIFWGYEVCKREFEKDKRKIYNSTVGGKLEVFERKKLEDAI